MWSRDKEGTYLRVKHIFYRLFSDDSESLWTTNDGGQEVMSAKRSANKMTVFMPTGEILKKSFWVLTVMTHSGKKSKKSSVWGPTILTCAVTTQWTVRIRQVLLCCLRFKTDPTWTLSVMVLCVCYPLLFLSDVAHTQCVWRQWLD